MDSWDIYTRYAQFYDLIQFSSLKKQFTSNIIDIQVYWRVEDEKVIYFLYYICHSYTIYARMT